MVTMVTSSAPLPTFHTSFLGRRRELRDIRALFAESGVRLVSLIGPGGVGKTRLAVQVGENDCD